MKKYFPLIVTVALTLIFSSCKKDEFQNRLLVGLRIVNTVTGGTTAKLNSFTNNISNNLTTTAGINFSLEPGNPEINVWPINDTLKPYYNSSKAVAMSEGEYYTLFLGGTPAATEPILVKENYQNYEDSVMGVRFVNLSPNSTPLNVTLSTSTTTNEFAGVAYKSITDFKLFPATKNITSYVFQVRAAANPNTVLASVTISFSGTSAIPRFKNITLVFRGNVGAGPGITRVNLY